MANGRNDKKSYGGKYKLNNDAGVKHWLHQQDWGVKRTFEGSGSKTYLFRNPNGGIIILRAPNYKEAKRVADSRGYKQYRKTTR